MRKLCSALFALGAITFSLWQAQTAAAELTPTVKALCAVSSVRPLSLLMREKIKAQYLAAGHKNVIVFVGVKLGRGQLAPLTFANIQGVSGVTVTADGSGVQIGTGSTPVGIACNAELPVQIKVSYLPAGTQGPRKTVNLTQKVNFAGSFR